MFDLGTMGEVLIIALAALILIGPKEMPVVLRALGRLTQKVKFMTSSLRYEFTKHIQQGELEEYTKKINTDVLSKEKMSTDFSQQSHTEKTHTKSTQKSDDK